MVAKKPGKGNNEFIRFILAIESDTKLLYEFLSLSSDPRLPPPPEKLQKFFMKHEYKIPIEDCDDILKAEMARGRLRMLNAMATTILEDCPPKGY